MVLALWRSLTNALWQFLLETWWDSNRLEFHRVGGPGPKRRQKHNLLDPVAGPPVGNQQQTRGIPMSKATTSKSDATANDHHAQILPPSVYPVCFAFFVFSFFALQRLMPKQTLTSPLDFPPFQRQKQQWQRRGKHCWSRSTMILR